MEFVVNFFCCCCWLIACFTSKRYETMCLSNRNELSKVTTLFLKALLLCYMKQCRFFHDSINFHDINSYAFNGGRLFGLICFWRKKDIVRWLAMEQLLSFWLDNNVSEEHWSDFHFNGNWISYGINFNW